MRLWLMLALLTTGCATVAETPAEVAAPPEDKVPEHGVTTGRCDAARASALVGRQATAELGAEAKRLTGAGSVRWLTPGALVTMEYRADRLGIELDRTNKVIAFRCG